MNRLAGFLNKSDLDAILLVSGSNIMYATAYKADYAYVLMTKSALYYLTDGRFTLEAKVFLGEEYQIIDVNTANVYTVMREILEKECVKNIGFDTDISYYQYRDLTQELTNYNLSDITEKITALRTVKYPDEIENIIVAQRIAERSLDQLLPDIKEGVTELELAAKLECLMRLNGSEGASFNSIVAFAANSAFAHARPSNNKLKFGDIILIDFGATYKGYCSDMTRTFVYGEASEQIIKMYNAVLDANTQAIEALNSSKSTKQIDNVAREVLSKHSLEKYFTHSLGHGVGIDIHEFPSLSPRANESMLLDGMVVTVEPGVYIEGVGGIRIEDMLVVGSNFSRNLTTYDKSLKVIK